MSFQVTVTGGTPAELVKQLNVAAGLLTATITTPGKLGGATRTAPKKAAPAVVEDEDESLSLGDDEDTTEETEELSFDSMGDDEDEEVEVAPKKKSGKTAKVTEKELNAACMAYAKEHGRPATMKLLKSKFKVGSLTEIKPEQYAQVIAALKA